MFSPSPTALVPPGGSSRGVAASEGGKSEAALVAGMGGTSLLLLPAVLKDRENALLLLPGAGEGDEPLKDRE